MDGNEKSRTDRAALGRGKRGFSTPYGGMVRVRFGGLVSRVEMSQPAGRTGSPVGVSGKVGTASVECKRDFPGLYWRSGAENRGNPQIPP
jgi:hypothetical protein